MQRYFYLVSSANFGTLNSMLFLENDKPGLGMLHGSCFGTRRRGFDRAEIQEYQVNQDIPREEEAIGLHDFSFPDKIQTGSQGKQYER